MQEFIKINMTNAQQPTVSGRELHQALGIETRYNDWFRRMCEYGFTEGEDFNLLKNERVQMEGSRCVKREVIDHQLTIDMAKELCMIQRTDIGRRIRQYFIRVEKERHQYSPMLQELIALETQQRQLVQTQEQHEQKLHELSDRQEQMTECFAPVPDNWEKQIKDCIALVNVSTGRSFQEVYREFYEQLNFRAGVSLEARVREKKKRLAKVGATKTQLDVVTKLQMIGEDKKLREIAVSLARELTAKLI